MTEDLKTLGRAFMGFVAVSLLYVGLIGINYFSLKHPVAVESMVEWGQEAFLLLSVAVVLSTLKSGFARGALILVAGFLGVLFVRELDAYMDEIVHGFWKWPAVLVLLTSLFAAYKVGVKETVHDLAQLVKTKSFVLLCPSVAMLLVYSRLFGFKGMWASVHGAAIEAGHQVASWGAFKSFGEEAAELLAYALIFVAVLVLKCEAGCKAKCKA